MIFSAGTLQGFPCDAERTGAESASAKINLIRVAVDDLYAVRIKAKEVPGQLAESGFMSLAV